MSTFIAAAIILSLAMTGLALGLFFKRGCIRGHCGGSVQTQGDHGCTCGRFKDHRQKP